jgi:hypothetical protein
MAKMNLATIAAATLAGTLVYVSEKDGKKLVADGLIEVNPAMPNPENATEFAARATPAGIEKYNADNAPAATKPAFEFITSPALGKTRQGGGRTDKYPFADFPAPTTDENGAKITAKIFVPATEKMPDPAKSLSSTVSAASRRYAEVESQKPGKNKNGEDIMRIKYKFSRKFALVPAEVDGVKGAYIERIL